MFSAQLRSPQPQPLRRPRREILDEHVGLGDQFGQNVLRLGMFDIQRQAVLGAVQPDEIGRLTFDGLVIVARKIADLGPFDLDHPRTEVSELAGAERRGNGLFEGDDGDALQR